MRWIALAPAVFASWLAIAIAIAGINAHDWLEKALCPPGKFWDGLCYDPAPFEAQELLIRHAVGLSAIVVVLMAVAVAPTHRRLVAWTTFALGSVVALVNGWGVHDMLLAAVAIGSGLIATLAIHAALRRRHGATNSHAD